MLCKKTIYINSNESIQRNAFSLAHEIAHVVLHNEENHTFKPIRFRSDSFSDADKVIEQEANEFAAHILMLTPLLEDDLKNINQLSESDIQNLADKYAVSKTAMSIRLSNLGFERLF